MPAAKRSNMVQLQVITSKRYTGYRWADKNPAVDWVVSLIEQSGLTYADIARRSGVTSQTLSNWSHGKTKRPQFSTLDAVVRSLGYEFGAVRTISGEVIRFNVRAD